MSGASSVLPISQVGHQALGFTTGADLVWQRDKRGMLGVDGAGDRRSWAILAPKFFVKKLERRWLDQLCGAGGKEVVQ